MTRLPAPPPQPQHPRPITFRDSLRSRQTTGFGAFPSNLAGAQAHSGNPVSGPDHLQPARASHFPGKHA